jgi:hypothetical protein
LKEIIYDEKNNQLKFDMPFNWNVSRLNDVKIFVHQEISIPKSSHFSAQVYSGEVNGIPVDKMIMIDGSNATKDVIHFMIPKNELISIAEKVNESGKASLGLMDFKLKPGIGSSANTTIAMNMTIMK